jgi:hypothetical protein
MDSKPITVFGLIKDLRVSLDTFPYISFDKNLVVIDILDAWGMLLSRESTENVGRYPSYGLVICYHPSP